MATEIDRLVVVFDANFKAMEEKLNRVIAKNAAAKKKIEESWKHTPIGAGFNDAIKGVEGLANELPILGAALEALGPAGIIAAVAIGTFVAAVEAGKKAAEFGDEIYKSAAKIGVSTDTLQEYRFALGEVGGETKDADAAILSFTETLGKAALGAPKAKRAFDALKLDPKSFGSADDALQAVLARLSEISNLPERAGLAKMLGLEAMLPLAAAGADALKELREEAERTGQVMDASTVQAAHRAADEFENAGHAAKVQFEAALVPLADLTVTVANGIAAMSTAFRDLTRDIGDASRLLAPFAEEVGRAIEGMIKNNPEIEALLGLFGTLRQMLRDAASAGRTKALSGMMKDLLAGKKLTGTENLYGTVDAPGPAKPGFTPGDIGKPAAKPPADVFRERMAEIEGQLDSAEKDFLTAWQALTVGVDRRTELQHEIADKEYEVEQDALAKRRAQITKDVHDKKLTGPEAAILNEQIDQLALEQGKTKELRDEKIDIDHAAAVRAQELAHLEMQIGVQADTLNAARALARTAAERQKIELQLLDLADQRLIAEQRAIIAGQNTPEAKADAAARIVGIQATAGQRRQAVVNANQGPLGSYFQSLPQNVDEVNERMQALASQGIASVIDGLAGAAAGTQKLGDVFKNVVTQMIADLVRLRLEAMISSVFKALSGNPVAAIAASMPVADTVVPYASGTSSSGSGWAMVGERGPELVRLPGGSQVIPNSALRNVGIGGGAAAAAQTIVFDNRGAVIWEQAARQLMAYADRAAMGAGSAAVAISRRATAGDLTQSAARRFS